MNGEGVDEGATRRWVEADGIHIDVRGLPPPQPMVSILALVESISDATPVVVHHERDPLFLYPELAEIGWTSERLDAPEGEVRLLLKRAA
ncbi:MAG TPA: DUF2249 domain-containing protein [Casimicrobiaceae bacterium]|nr:DUF2249 domain-containing protein [Casimicrobiaceae bacterium]